MWLPFQTSKRWAAVHIWVLLSAEIYHFGLSAQISTAVQLQAVDQPTNIKTETFSAMWKTDSKGESVCVCGWVGGEGGRLETAIEINIATAVPGSACCVYESRLGVLSVPGF